MALNMIRGSKFYMGVLAVLMIALILSATAFIIVEADHDCSGADCHICHQIDICCNALRLLIISFGSLTIFFSLTAEMPYTSSFGIMINRSITLILLKVKLSN